MIMHCSQQLLALPGRSQCRLYRTGQSFCYVYVAFKKINNNALELDFTHALQPVCRIFILLWSWQKEKS